MYVGSQQEKVVHIRGDQMIGKRKPYRSRVIRYLTRRSLSNSRVIICLTRYSGRSRLIKGLGRRKRLPNKGLRENKGHAREEGYSLVITSILFVQ